MRVKNIYSKLTELVLILLVFILIGIISNENLFFVYKKTEDNKISEVEELKEFIEVYEEILSRYYKEVDKKHLIQGAIEGMLSTLGDPNSSFLDSEKTSSFNDRMTGQYKGIGVEILDTNENEVLIVNIFENSPAYKSNLKVGDVIVSIDGVDITKLASFEIANIIKYKPSDDIKIGIKRKDELLEFDLIKEEIILSSVVKEVFEVNNKKQGYIKISIFAANTYSQFKQALLELESENIDELIIDVRNNSGGYLSSVSNLLELFIENGKPLYKMQTKEKTETIYSESLEKRNYPVKVLINQYSASASEILAIGLKESYNATLFGVTSYGKGTVQEIFLLDSGAMTKITIKEWLSPKGNKIDGIGVVPDIEIKSEIMFTDYSEDLQLQETLKK